MIRFRSFAFLSADVEVYLKSKMTELMQKQADGATLCDSGEYYVNGGLYADVDDVSKRKSLANESKASVYFTPTESVDMSQLQLSPIHINYMKENNFDMLTNSLKRPPKFFGHRRDLEQQLDCESGADADEFTLMIEANDFAAALNPTAKQRLKKHCRVNSNDFYYSLENVHDSKLNDAQMGNFQPMKIFNDLTIDEASEAHMSNSSASDNCSSENNLDKITPDEETNDPLDAGLKLRKGLYPSNSLPNLKRNSSAHASKDHGGAYVVLAVEPDSVVDTADCLGPDKGSTRRSV